MEAISLRTNERVFITGKTGSGKTFLSRYLTRSCPRLVVLDGKAVLGSWDLAPWTPEGRDLLRDGSSPVRMRVTIPDPKTDPAPFWNDVMYECYQGGNVTVYIDELYMVAPPGKPAPPLLWGLYTRGRELGIGVWGCSQRPAWLPLFTMSEAEHFFSFRLQMDDDRKRMAEFMGKEVFREITDEHGFYYARAEWSNPEYVQQLEVKPDGGQKEIEIKPEYIPPDKMSSMRYGSDREKSRAQRKRALYLFKLP